MWPVGLGSVRTGDDINTIFSEVIDFKLFLLRGLESVGITFHSLAFSGAEMRAKLQRNLWNTLHNPKNDYSLVILVDSVNLYIASVVRDLVLRRLGRIACFG